MSTQDQLRSAELLLRGWPSDEDVERLTGVSLLDIIAIRAQAASESRHRPVDAPAAGARRGERGASRSDA